ncbi:protocadherin Fat 4-like [Haliotis rubra]|uniref:protocadherin Fat 4-like n=1 Tax=Haliotis rubra TaxID=36100 RepID=UPI001EE55758|nr:protocadherin Fat 4-like [Haliotis rubra]
MTVRATDLGTPTQQSTQVATVRINVLRNNNCPQFINLPANITIPTSVNFGNSLYNITALDNDPPGRFSTLIYDIIGDDNAPVYFSINTFSGAVSALPNLVSDTLTMYRLRVRGRDGGSPSCEIYEVLTIHIPNNVVIYSLAQTSNYHDIFFVDDVNGNVYLRTSLIGTTSNSYELSLVATDQGSPALSSTPAKLIVNVIRNVNPPIFTMEPYTQNISQNVVTGFQVITVLATDADLTPPYNTLTYDIIGDDSAPTYFVINPSSGVISLSQSISSDVTDQYQIRVRVQDGGSPRLSDVIVVLVNVERNLFPPTFTSNSYGEVILESRTVGTRVLRVSANDLDTTTPNQIVRYGMLGDTIDSTYFMIEAVTGDVIVRRPLTDDTQNTVVFAFQATANDLGALQRNATPVDVTITVRRNQNSPEFLQTSYTTTVTQNHPGGSSVYQTTVADRDTVAPFNVLSFELIGDDSATSFFTINPSSGLITLRNGADLTTDTEIRYIARVLARDGGVPSRSATSVVVINVLRNLFPPVFMNVDFFRTSIKETLTVGSNIADVNATDADTTAPENTIQYSIEGDDVAPEYFFINPNTGEITLLKPVENININLFRIASYRVLGISPAPTFFDVSSQIGAIAVRRDLRLDPARLTFYQLQIEATATLDISVQTATTVVNITVTRNENGPVFTDNSYVTSIRDTTVIGTVVLTVTASDMDGDLVDYRMLDSNSAGTYFYLNPRTGQLSTKISLREINLQRVQFQIQAGDQRAPERTSRSNVTIVIERDQQRPQFVDDPYTTAVQETTVNGSTVYQVSAFDADLQGSLTYEIIGEGVAPAFFEINSNTGMVTVYDREALLFDRGTNYKLVVVVYDSAYPAVRDTAEIGIAVLRNINTPIFTTNTYEVTIPDTYELGTNITQVSASDSDDNIVKYEITGDTRALEFYYVNPDNGVISLKKLLTEGSQPTDTLTIRARDQGVPEKFGNCLVIVSIKRDDHAPVFTRVPYRATVQRLSPVNMTVIRATATDQDLQGTLQYEILGNYPAPSFFQIDAVLGDITIKRPLAFDSLLTNTYYVTMVTFDTVYPSNRATATATIFVDRNPNGPTFNPQVYERQIDENTSLGALIVDVNATDLDNDVIRYSLKGDTLDNEFFYLNEDTGYISLRKNLLSVNDRQFRFNVIASDQSNPERTSTANVIVNIIRDEAPPQFVQLPYDTVVLETTNIGTSVYRVSAIDSDIKGTIVYTATGDLQAPYYFNINQTNGIVTVRNNIRDDVASNYALRVAAFDNASPGRTATALLSIQVLRNPSPPIFTSSRYEITIPEHQNLGSVVQQVMASDPDGDVLRFNLELDNSASASNSLLALEYFYILEQSGVIYLRKPLTDDTVDTARFTMLARARDQRDNEKESFAVVVINVQRDQFLPVFSQTPYITSLEETVPVGTVVFRPSAFDRDLVEELEYRVIGDTIGPFYFGINSTNGVITLKNNLRTDNANFNYTLRLTVIDTAYPTEVATATVDIRVSRNIYAPQFTQSPYRVTINETASVGVGILQVSATDADGDRVIYEAAGDNDTLQYFFLSSDTGLISIREPLTSSSRSGYRMSIIARDQGNPEQKTPVLALITVIRDQAAPFFINTQDYSTIVNEAIPVGSSVFNVTAQDGDLLGAINYELIGDYPTQSFFSVDIQTGQIVTTDNLKSDSLRSAKYVARIIAYDTIRPMVRATSTVAITVVRNPNRPQWLQSAYIQTISETMMAGTSVLNVTANDRDADDIVTYEILSQTSMPFGLTSPYFYIERQTGIITLRESVLNADISQVLILLRACDNGIPRQCANSSAGIDIIRNQFSPVFQNLPYEIVLPEATEASTQATLLNVSAIDQDLIGQIVYEQVLPGSAYFDVNPASGAITLRSSLLLDSRLQIVFQVLAYDDKHPQRKTTADVTVNVLRNPSGPRFLQDPYEATVSETYPLGDSLINATAVDSDGDVLRYSLMSLSIDENLFYINPDNGLISLRKLLSASTATRYSLTVKATDQRIPEQTATALVLISVTRDNSAPFFVGGPYAISVPETREINSTIVAVSARDSDMKGSIQYEAIGVYPATSFFNVEATSGNIRIIRSLLTDGLLFTSYTLRVVAFDTAYPTARATSDVTIVVIRNENGPSFLPSATYETQVSEDVVIGTSILQITAVDQDAGDVVTYQLVNATSSGTQYFFLDRDAGIISTKKALSGAPEDLYTVSTRGVVSVRKPLKEGTSRQYTFTVQVRDQAFPELFSTTTVQITIDRDQFPPVFTQMTYVTAITETTEVNTSQPIVVVQAADKDRREDIVYEAIGDGSALAFFRIDSTSGAVYVKTPLIQDSLVLYTLRVQAYDTFYPTNIGYSTVTISVIRNPSGPVFTANEHAKSVLEFTTVGSRIITVTATDADGDVPVYSLVGGMEALEYFYISPSSGDIFLKKRLYESPTQQYQMFVQASDQRNPVRLTNTTVFVTVARSQPPRFVQGPYSFSVSEKTQIGTSVYGVSAIDSDKQGTITYEIVGDAPAPSYFAVNSTTGVVTVRSNLLLDSNQNYILRVKAHDSAFMSQTATATISIFIARNDNPPIFIREPYTIELPEEFALGQRVINITAEDADNDNIRYSMLSSSLADYFYLNPDTGVIFLTKSLESTVQNSFLLSVRASDSRIPQRSNDATVTITVRRNKFLPQFVGLPYTVTIGETRPVNDTILSVAAVDNDQRGTLVYEAVGFYPAQSFFGINNVTGHITVIQSLKNDGLARTEYTLRVVVYDTQVPAQRLSADVLVSVGRNLNAPTLTQTRYSQAVDEDYPLGVPVLNVTASDLDGDTISYDIVADNSGGSALSFFFIERPTGAIYLRQPLSASSANTFAMTVRATDSGRPPRESRAEVVVYVRRDEFAPRFENSPLVVVIPETTANASTIFTVTATDQDQQGSIQYSVMGVPPAPTFFMVTSGGNIVVRGDLRNDRAMNYVLRIRAVDSANLNVYTEEDVKISILRNVNHPDFQQQSYSTRISETTRIGTSLLTVVANDADNDRLTYDIRGDERCVTMFYVGADNGFIYLRQSVMDTADSSFTCTVSVSDNGYPTANTATTTVFIGIDRDTVVPVFSSNGRYAVNINENIAVGSFISSVQATRQNLAGRMYYEIIGNYPAPSFFKVHNMTGEITVEENLRNDNLRLGSYTLRVRTYDTSVPHLAAIAEVYITVLRNLNGPVFSPSTYRVTLREDVDVGTYIQKLNVSDPDGVQLSCSVDAQAYFAIDASTCLLRVSKALTDDTSKATEYTIFVTATEMTSSNRQFATASVQVTVLRDLYSPQFNNLPATIDVNEDLPVDRAIFTADAYDADIQGTIKYELTGVFPAKSFFEIDPSSGAIVLMNSLLSDTLGRTSYTARVQIYDTARPDNRTQADLVIRVVRNSNGPIFSSASYEASVEENFPLYQSLVQVVASDADGDKLTYTHLGTAEEQKLFYLNPDSGVISLGSSLQDTSKNQFVFEVEASDNRVSSIAKTNRVTVVITVQRDNGPPRFLNAPYVLDVPIRQPVNSTVVIVIARDPDNKGMMRYRLDGIAPGTDYFSISDITGNIIVKQELTLNTDVYAKYTLLVSAYDTSSPEIVITEPVQIRVLRNLYSPVFVTKSYMQTIYDFIPVGSSVLQVTATDDDITAPENTFTYDIDNTSPANEFFSVDPFSGIIRTTKDLSESTASSYVFNIISRDLGASSRSDTATATVVIQRNSGRPVFINPDQYDVTVSETMSVLSPILHVQAVDTDSVDTPNGQIVYTLTGPAEAQRLFEVHMMTGNITARVSLTTAANDTYELTIRASDRGTPTQSSEVTVVIRIRREGTPFFQEPEYIVSLTENTAIDTVVIDLNATDPLDNKLIYEINGDGMASTLFRVSPDTGLVSVAQPFKTDTQESYVIRIRAYRQTDAAVFATVIVRVVITRNANAPSFLHNDLVFNLAENYPLGVSLGQLNATDKDIGNNGRITYTIDAQNSIPLYVRDFFYVSPTTGTLSVTKSLQEDANQPLSYVLNILATDNGYPTKFSALQVTVNVVRNRNGPAFSSDVYETDIDEDVSVGTSLLQVQAADADGGRVTYTLLSTIPTSLYFNVDENTGVLSMAASLLMDNAAVYTMTVRARDYPGEGALYRSSEATLVVTVRRNPNTPVFVQSAYNITISEYTAVQDVVATIRATDADPSDTPSGQLVYRITSVTFPGFQSSTLRNNYDFFIISPTSADIYLAQTLSKHGVPDTFYITIEAADRALPPKIATAQLEIHIVRNIHTPRFTSTSYGATIEDTAAVGRTLFTVTALDADEDVPLNQNTPNAEFNYIVDPKYKDAVWYFDVSSDGIVSIRNPLVSTDTPSFFFNIIAIDKSWTPLSSRVPVRINVTRTSTGPRILGFTAPIYYVVLPENSVGDGNRFKSLIVLDTENQDIDLNVECRIIYINGEADLVGTIFSVRTTRDGKNCELYMIGNLDREQGSLYNITVGVHHQTTVSKRSINNAVYNTWEYTNILVSVTDVNDNAPSFNFPVYPVVNLQAYVTAISIAAPPNSKVTQVQATDPDLGLNGIVSYSVSPIPGLFDEVPFYINFDGEIYTTKDFSHEEAFPRQFVFKVTASDNAMTSERLQAESNVYVNLIENKNRFILVLTNTPPENVIPKMEFYRQALQNVTGRIIIIEKIQGRLFTEVGSSVLDLDITGTDITFVVVNSDSFRLEENTAMDM